MHIACYILQIHTIALRHGNENTHTRAVAPHSERSRDYSQNAGSLEAHLLVLAPGGSLP